eukprot:4772811-Pleurochrysis_carterae.AAC.1
MHGSPNWTRIACALAERSRSAPRTLGTRARDGCCCPSEPTSSSHRVGASQPPRPRELPMPDRLYCNNLSLLPAPDGSNSGSSRWRFRIIVKHASSGVRGLKSRSYRSTRALHDLRAAAR